MANQFKPKPVISCLMFCKTPMQPQTQEQGKHHRTHKDLKDKKQQIRAVIDAERVPMINSIVTAGYCTKKQP